MNPDEPQEWLATCPRGLGAVLADELRDLGAINPREVSGGVRFSGTRASMYRACLWSRVASRLLFPLGEGPADNDEAFFGTLAAIPWESLIRDGATIAVDFFGSSDQIRNTRFGAQRSKDAIVDRFRGRGLKPPVISLQDPQLRIQVRLRRGRVDLALDMAGESLHRRGYRVAAGAAPLKENLAAAVLLRADWPSLARDGAALVDPMCGSATLLLEGALMAADRAPGLHRDRYGFEGWHGHDEAQWGAIRADALGRAERGRQRGLPEIRGYDGDPRVIARAQENIAAAGLSKWVRVSVKSLGEVKKPTHKPLPMGLLVTNPPYGQRLGDREALPMLYRRLGALMHDQFPGWQAAVLAGDRDLGKALGLRSHRQYALVNGKLPVTLVLLDLTDNRLVDGPPGPYAAGGEAQGGLEPADAEADGAGGTLPAVGQGVSPAALESARMFSNRLRKNQRRLKGWLKQQGYTSYRLYDADIPEYALAVDRYGDWLHVAEYRAPAGIDETVAAERLAACMELLPEALRIDASRIVLKRRQRQRGSDQYRSTGRGAEMISVEEGPARLLVNLHDYLDTGLFLDHRPLRQRIGRETTGKHFLNLFCYTGAATIHAALGDARRTTSVDLSNTYLRWLRRNLAHNGISEARHQCVRSDVLQWLREDDGLYDIVLLDPPSFSNSSRLPGSFDVQRDHAGLIDLAMRRLAPNGVLYFSNNRRRFRLAAEVSERYRADDITEATLDPDFNRRPGPHRCWKICAKVSPETDGD